MSLSFRCSNIFCNQTKRDTGSFQCVPEKKFLLGNSLLENRHSQKLKKKKKKKKNVAVNKTEYKLINRLILYIKLLCRIRY